MKKLSRLAVMLALVLALTACSGGADTPSPDEQTEGQHPVTDTAELEGQWTSPSGNILSFSADQGRYTYQTFTGRTGQGPYDAAADVPTIDFDGFLYDFILRDDGVLLPNQNGSGGDAESIDHFTFRRSSDARIDLWELSDLSGVWQNALGETLVIDADRMAYLSYTRLSMGSGTIGDDQDGKGPYLAMNGRIYLSPAWIRTGSPCWARMRTAASPACSTPTARQRPIPACRGPALRPMRTAIAAGTATVTTPFTLPEATPWQRTGWPIATTARCMPTGSTPSPTIPPRTGAIAG